MFSANLQLRRVQYELMSTTARSNFSYWVWLIIAIGLVCLGLWFYSANIRAETEKKNAEESIEQETDILNEAFSGIDQTSLSPLQVELLDVIKSEYARSPEGYDDTVMKYTEGFEESWCADFISWVMKEAGSPNISSETGYWRIPGVLSLQSYYMNISNAYFDSKSSYTPQLGDVAFYIGDATPDFDSSEHAAIVLSYDGTTLVTIGGNEGDDGVLRIRKETVEQNLEKGLVGYGVFE